VRYPFLTSLLLATAVCASAFNTPAAARIVAIADVHGGFEPFVSILTTAGLIDAQRRWSGGSTVFVQTGDVTDRGAGVRDALDLLMALEKAAPAAGGKVHVLLGNHEVMNLLGDTRDVSAEALNSFGGEAAYRAAFARDGKYGKWLRTKPILQVIDGTVFMHAGINLEFTQEALDELNQRVRREIAEWDQGRRWLEQQNLVKPSSTFQEVLLAARAEIDRVNAIMADKKHLPPETRRGAMLVLPVANIGASGLLHGDGPMWFRGFATWPDEQGEARMAALLKHHQVSRFVTGHSPQASGRINERFGGALFLIDTGMLNGRFYPAGRPSALEITGGTAKPVYLAEGRY
jgi:hypothetical protein